MYTQRVSFVGKLIKILKKEVKEPYRTLSVMFVTNKKTIYKVDIKGYDTNKSWDYLTVNNTYKVENAEFIPTILDNKVVLVCEVDLNDIYKIDTTFLNVNKQIKEDKTEDKHDLNNDGYDRVGDLSIDYKKVPKKAEQVVIELDRDVEDIDEINNKNLSMYRRNK